MALWATIGTGCEQGTDPSGNPAITAEDVEGIQPGDAVGAVYSGTWVLKTKVSATNCLPLSIGLEGFPPKVGDADDESYVLVQNGGELTRGADSVGEIYTFKGGVNQDGSFTFGSVITVSKGPPAIERIEIVGGRFQLDRATLSATVSATTIKRRYQGGGVDCSADLDVLSGERTLAGETTP